MCKGSLAWMMDEWSPQWRNPMVMVCVCNLKAESASTLDICAYSCQLINPNPLKQCGRDDICTVVVLFMLWTSGKWGARKRLLCMFLKE
ncbi:hypothetical protein BRADI_2g34056v3 [Brachypodium distachyon]|uniref:Uncharacterized protein n=1 Tax=Brachypodium distachyon TaxID=15368 RepID=A0A0Q3G796_BRADI|nr:hypothetical protein BRADI_2g34056v3 [Brachypodium distachyon]